MADRIGDLFAMPLSENLEDRRGERIDPQMAAWLSRHQPPPIPRLPVQTEDPMAVAAGYNWIGQSPRPTFADRVGDLADQSNYQ